MRKYDRKMELERLLLKKDLLLKYGKCLDKDAAKKGERKRCKEKLLAEKMCYDMKLKKVA